jgi:uncharacterized protein YndB with AHSA1/START domain
MIPDPETDLVLTRGLHAPRAQIRACWTTPALLMRFFVPAPHSVTACEIDLRPGGRFDTTFLVDGERIENSGVRLEVVEGRRLVFTDAYTEGWKPAPEPFMTAILDLDDEPEGGTRYTATARHRSAEDCQRHAEMGFHQGRGVVADQLETLARSLG